MEEFAECDGQYPRFEIIRFEAQKMAFESYELITYESIQWSPNS